MSEGTKEGRGNERDRFLTLLLTVTSTNFQYSTPLKTMPIGVARSDSPEYCELVRLPADDDSNESIPLTAGMLLFFFECLNAV